jgi:hypothetical protein
VDAYRLARSSLAREIAVGGLATERERKMTRTSSILSLILAMLVALVAAAAASAAPGYQSTDSILASGTTQTTTASSDPGAKSLFAGTTGDRSPSAVSGSAYRSADAILAGQAPSQPAPLSGGDYRSADAVLAASGSPQPSAVKSSGQGYVDALLRSSGTSQPQPVAVVETKAGEGFHWGDALIGALIASVLMLTMLAAARSVARHRRATVESRA